MEKPSFVLAILIVQEHESLLKVLKNGDIAAIRPLMQQHLFGVTRLVSLIFTKLKDYFTTGK